MKGGSAFFSTEALNISSYSKVLINSMHKKYLVETRFLKKKTLSLILLLILVLSVTATLWYQHTISPNDSTSYTANAVWIVNAGWVRMNQNILQNNLTSVLTNLHGSHIKYAFVFVGYWNSTSNDIDYAISDELIALTINGLHAINVTVLAWAENGDTNLDVRATNRNNLYASITKCVNKGFDGYNDDVESYNGTLQDWIDYLNEATPILHNLGKLMTADVGYDWPQNVNPHLRMDYIVSMFYDNKSVLEDSRASAYWQEDFVQFLWNNKPPGSPMILGIMNYYGNAHPLAWQLSQIDRLLASYRHPQLVGFSIWLYEYMGTNQDDWQQWNNWTTLHQIENPPR